MNHALTRTGRPPQPAAQLVRFVGDGARTLLARSAQVSESGPEVEELLKHFLDYYVAHPIEFTRWAKGAQEALDAFSERMPEVALGICTNKPRVVTDVILAALGIRTRFRGLVAGGDGPEKKPAPGPLLRLASILGVPPAHLVMVGDSPQDIECARQAGARAVAITSGFAPIERLALAHPDVMLATMAELPDVVQRWREATTRITVDLGKQGP